MALTPKRIAGGEIDTVATAYYTAAPSTRTRIDAFTIINHSAGAALFSLWLVSSGGLPDDTNIVVKDHSLAANESYVVIEALGQWIEGAGALYLISSVANALTVTASGIEQSV